MSPLRHYRDDGPLVELSARALPARPDALRWTSAALLPLLASFAVPPERAPLAVAVAAAVAGAVSGAAARGPHAGRLDWLVPPLLRLAEYAALLRLAVLQGGTAVPACYLLLAALAYRHYDLVYRLRDRGEQPSARLRRLGLGWDGRLTAAGVLASLGVFTPAAWVAGGVLLLVHVVESAAAWRRQERTA